MRNILQYPITKEEKLDALRRAHALLVAEIGDAIGGVELYALQLVIEDITRTPECSSTSDRPSGPGYPWHAQPPS